MSKRLPAVLRIYGRLSLVFVVLYAPFIVYDDLVLIRRITSSSEFGLFLLVELMGMFVYFLVFTGFYWSAALVVLLGRKWLER